jgi:hypothetical protein
LPECTINGVTKTATWQYFARDITSDAKNWPPRSVGLDTLPNLGGYNTIALINVPYVFSASNDDILLDSDTVLNWNYYWLYATLPATVQNPHLTTEDFVMEYVIRTPTITASGSAPWASSWDWESGKGWCFYFINGRFSFALKSADGTSVSVDSPPISPNTYYHVVIYVNRSGGSTSDCTFILNGVSSLGTDPSALDGKSIAPGVSYGLDYGVGLFVVGPGGTGPTNHMGLIYANQFRGDNWLGSGTSGLSEATLWASHRFHALTGGTGTFNVL